MAIISEGKSAESRRGYMHQHLVKSLNVSVWVKNWVMSEWWQPVSLPAVDHFSTAAVTDHLLSFNPLCYFPFHWIIMSFMSWL